MILDADDTIDELSKIVYTCGQLIVSGEIVLPTAFSHVMLRVN
jgi:hypothetical protein